MYYVKHKFWITKCTKNVKSSQEEINTNILDDINAKILKQFITKRILNILSNSFNKITFYYNTEWQFILCQNKSQFLMRVYSKIEITLNLWIMLYTNLEPVFIWINIKWKKDSLQSITVQEEKRLECTYLHVAKVLYNTVMNSSKLLSDLCPNFLWNSRKKLRNLESLLIAI